MRRRPPLKWPTFSANFPPSDPSAGRDVRADPAVLDIRFAKRHDCFGETTTMRTNTGGRILAVQALYQLDFRGDSIREAVDEFLHDTAKDDDALAYARELIDGYSTRRDELDACIAQAAEHWDVGRMAPVDRAILRVGAYELLHRPDVPPKVAINEAIRLAKKFSTAESGAFVNGILDRVRSGTEHLETETP